jgi:hypothetical protein
VSAGTLLQTRQVCVSDGLIAKSFFSEGVLTDGSPMGYLRSDPRLSEVKFVALAPITLTIRGLEPAINPLPMGDMKPSGPALPIDRILCQEYAIDYGHGSTVICWLDASKDYAVRRIRTQRRGRLLDQTDVTSYRHEGCGWIPVTWVCNQYSSTGAALKTNKVQVLELRLNEPQPAERFELQFPPGAMVGDGKDGKYYRIQSDGSMAQISPGGKELSGSVPQPGAPWYHRHKWRIVGIALLFPVAGLLYAMRRKWWRRG